MNWFTREFHRWSGRGARENPLAAALIGGGALWLLIGSDKLKNAAGSVTSAAAPLADLGARAQRSAASSLGRYLRFHAESRRQYAGRSLAPHQ